MKGYPGTTPTVEALGKLNFEGNIVPRTWRQWLRRDSGKVNSVAIDILAELVYWYRPILDIDETTGHVKGWRKKFKADKLQKSYQQLADALGHTERQIADNARWLKKRGYISIEKRSIGNLNNVLFMDIDVRKLEEISFPKSQSENLAHQGSQTQIRSNVGPKYVSTYDPVTLERRTYTENTNRNYTHSKEGGLDSEPSSGVCDQSLEATQEKRRPVSKPTPKAPNPLANISTRLKQLGIRASKALQTAANGLTEDELINACDALEEALEQGTVQNKQAWLTQAFRGRYEPADDWVSKAEQERLKQEALERQQEELRQQRQEHLDQIAKAKAMLLELEAKGEVKVYWENSRFEPGGSYAYEYIGHEKRFGVRYPQCDQMPMSLATAIMVRERREQLEAECEARRRGVA